MARQQFVQIDAGILASPDFRRLARRVGGPEFALASLFRLWSWSLVQGFQGGQFEWDEPGAVEECAVLPTGTLRAMIETGFVVEEPGSWYRIAGWEERYGRLERLREYDRERKRSPRKSLTDKQLPLERLESSGTPTDSSYGTPTELRRTSIGQRRGEERREEEVVSRMAEPVAAAAAPSPAPGFPSFPCSGPVKTWAPSVEQVAKWDGFFPGLDLLAEARKAAAWIEANPDRRKTARGMPRFLVAWFTRCVDQGGTRRPAAAAQDGPRRGPDGLEVKSPTVDPTVVAASRRVQAQRYREQAARAKAQGLTEIHDRMIEIAERFERDATEE